MVADDRLHQAELIQRPERILVCAGQTAMSADGIPQHVGDMAAQVELSLDNLEAVLDAAGMTLTNVVRLNMYTTDVDVFFAAHPAMVQRLAVAGVQPSGTLPAAGRRQRPVDVKEHRTANHARTLVSGNAEAFTCCSAPSTS